MSSTEKIGPSDRNELLAALEDFQRKSTKDKAPSAETDKIIHGLSKFINSLGQNKAVIESVVRSMPLPQIKEMIDHLQLFVKSQERDANKVSRKDTDHLPGNH
jgi:hypothetical protein